ncbi:MAG: hypothetical protein ACYS29_13160, partial [Planctomycetota bacterium]
GDNKDCRQHHAYHVRNPVHSCGSQIRPSIKDVAKKSQNLIKKIRTFLGRLHKSLLEIELYKKKKLNYFSSNRTKNPSQR